MIEANVVAIIPTIGVNPDRLARCVDSVAAAAGEIAGELSVIVIGNDPRRVLPTLAGIKLIVPGLNLGYPGALNHGRNQIDQLGLPASHLWLLQDDVEVLPSCLSVLLERLDRDPTVGVASPMIWRAGAPAWGMMRGGELAKDGTMKRFYPRLTDRDLPLEDGEYLDYLSLAGAVIPLKVWDVVGGMDPDFFPLLWSDVDVCYRIKQAGYRLFLEHNAHIDHEGGGSTSSFLHRYLPAVQGERFRLKHFDQVEKVPEPIAVNVDPELLAVVAKSASLGMLDLAAFGAVEIAQQEALQRECDEKNRKLLDDLDAIKGDLTSVKNELSAVKNELSAVRATKIWRYSRPLRILRSRLSRSFYRTQPESADDSYPITGLPRGAVSIPDTRR